MKKLNPVIIEKVQKIMALAVQVSFETEHDVFVRQSGHVNSIDAQVYEGGWSEEGERANLGSNQHVNGTIYLLEENISLLDSAIEHLEQLLCPTK